MKRIRSAVIVLLLASLVAWTGATSASATSSGKASARTTGKVVAQRGPAGEFGGPFQLKFKAGGTTRAHGTFAYREPGGYTVSGRVTCYHQEGHRAVFTGPVTDEANPDNDTESFVVWVADNDPALGGRDAFYVAGGALLGPDCAENFPLDIFDNTSIQESLYYVTRGQIIIR